MIRDHSKPCEHGETMSHMVWSAQQEEWCFGGKPTTPSDTIAELDQWIAEWVDELCRGDIDSYVIGEIKALFKVRRQMWRNA